MWIFPKKGQTSCLQSSISYETPRFRLGLIPLLHAFSFFLSINLSQSPLESPSRLRDSVCLSLFTAALSRCSCVRAPLGSGVKCELRMLSWWKFLRSSGQLLESSAAPPLLGSRWKSPARCASATAALDMAAVDGGEEQRKKRKVRSERMWEKGLMIPCWSTPSSTQGRISRLSSRQLTVLKCNMYYKSAQGG